MDHRHPGHRAGIQLLLPFSLRTPASDEEASWTPHQVRGDEDWKLRVASRGGENMGEVMLAEGLAERRGSRENVWC